MNREESKQYQQLLRERDEAEAARWRRIRQPDHGPYCTCQACGLPYEKCRCDLDELAAAEAERDELKLALAAALASWPKGFTKPYYVTGGGDRVPASRALGEK